jgi:hypothetical protein
MVQVLTEAGWSLIAYDHAKRNSDQFAMVMMYFVIMHVVIVLIVATLIKGIFWEVYFCVQSEFENR